MVQPLLRLRRGQLDLLRPAVRSERGAVGEANAARLPVQRQGLCAAHRASPRRGTAAASRSPGCCPRPRRRTRAAGSTMPSFPPRPATGRSPRSARRCSRSPTRASSATSCSRWRRGSAMAVRRSTISRPFPSGCPASPIAVEFRDASWLPGHTDEVLRFLAERGLTYVSVDAPRTPANVSSDLALTSPVAVIRLHGRNVQGFMKQLRGQAPTRGREVRLSLRFDGDRGDRRPRPRARRAGAPHLLQAEQQCRRRPRHQRRPDPGAAGPGHRRPRPGRGGVATAPAPRPPPRDRRRNPRARITHQKARSRGGPAACRSTSTTVGDVVAG